jgi:2-dehydro-3-deoxyphosphooctonate aldolase (KDO 8-P synthase)
MQQQLWKLFDWQIGLNSPLFLIAGPCVIESEELAFSTAEYLVNLTKKLGINFIYKSSYDKANRSSDKTFRGLGIDKGLQILSEVKRQYKVPILTDVHEIDEISQVADVVDVLQTPAFLCRQTNFIRAVAKTGKVVNIKKGQFLAPTDMLNVANKALAVENHGLIMVCERGVTFGYNNLVSDMRSLQIMRETNCPVIFDATHSVQLPGGRGDSSGGQSEFVATLAKAAVAVGVSGVFLETHPNPVQAKSDGANSIALDQLESLLTMLLKLDQVSKNL